MKKLYKLQLFFIICLLSSCSGTTSIPLDRLENAYVNGWTNKPTESVDASFIGLNNQKYFKHYYLRVASGDALNYIGSPYQAYGEGKGGAQVNDLNFSPINGYDPKYNGSQVDYSFSTEHGKAYQFAIWVYGKKGGIFGGSGNSGWIVAPGVMRVDLTTPQTPTIIANDRSSGDWGDGDIIFISTLDVVGEMSPRFNMYCLTKTGTCTYSQVQPDTSALSEGIYDYRVKSCTLAGNCSPESTFELKVDISAPDKPTITGSGSWSNDPSTSLLFEKRGFGLGPSPSTTYYCMDSLNTCNPNISGNTYNNLNMPEGISFVRAKTCDTGGCSPISSITIQKDYTSPVIGDISSYPSVGSNLLAKSSQSIRLNIDINDGAPISLIEGYFEDDSTVNSLLPSSFTTNASPFIDSFSIRDVDGDGTPSDGQREYTMQVSRVCDIAGNCSNLNVDLVYIVYANTTNIQSTILTNTISTGIADGSQNNFNFSLKDVYGNNIMNVPGISRTIDVNISGDNDLRLNQYNNQGNDSAIFIGDKLTSLPIGISQDLLFVALDSTNGEYNIPFYIYTPTTNTNSLIPGSATIQSISYDVNAPISIENGDRPQDQGVLGNTELTYLPLYTSSIGGEIFVNKFIEGTTQSIDVQVNKASSGRSVTLGSDDLLFEFGEYIAPLNTLNTGYNFSIDGTSINEGNQANISSLTRISGLHNFLGSTFLSQDAVVNTTTKSYLASVLTYKIDNKEIIYPGDIIGKTAYLSNTSEYNTHQKGVKVLGQTSSSNIGEIVTGQFTNDIRIVGDITKSTLKRDIIKNVSKSVRNVVIDNGNKRVVNVSGSFWDTQNISAGVGLLDDSVLYFGKLNGDFIELGNSISNLNIEGSKTLLVVGGDIYITSDIINNSTDDILGIMALSDASGNGGNIYINPEVTDVSAILYADKSLFSAEDTNGNGMISTNEIYSSSTSIDILKNQLYIHGSIFTENTIGGSRSNPLKCPYYVECSSLEEAQKYDLNYLRRYMKIDHDNDPTTPLENINGGQTSSQSLSQALYELFPVVIEYNPTIQSSPPPLFD